MPSEYDLAGFFHFGTYWSTQVATLHENQIELLCVAQKWRVEKRIVF
jgi:hypothetical protein